MEIKLDGMEIELGEGCEFELPSYMVRLHPENVTKEVKDKNKVIIAAGADPADGKITFITLSGRVMTFDARKFYIPDGPAVPHDGGNSIFLENTNGRWPGPSSGFSVEIDFLLEKSVSAFDGAVLQTNYIHENKSP